MIYSEDCTELWYNAACRSNIHYIEVWAKKYMIADNLHKKTLKILIKKINSQAF